jgi:hypothetical protein
MPPATSTPLLCALVALTTGCGAARYQHLVERALPATDALTCQGYLVWNAQPARDVFLVINGSGTLSNAFVNHTFDDVMKLRPVAYSTYDKPGIRAPFGDPARVRRDDALLERYTLGAGVACATEALRWARTQLGPSVRLHLRGHSEGSLVALYTYEALLDEDPDTASAIETIVLSGLPAEPFADILSHQLASMPRGEQLRAALSTCDRAVLMKRMGISCAYVEDAKRRPSGRAMFERLASRTPTARFYVFHGTGDWNTPVGPVRALEAWNTAEGHLPIEFHYYEGGHVGSAAARLELARLLSAIAAQ